MKVLDFIRINENWEELLAAAPYYVKATWDGDYVLLKYNQLASDFTNEIVRECRGCIMFLNNKDHEWAYPVCYPFDKFGNYGESYVPEIEWLSARVQEKVDGSLMKLWHHKGEWHISTNGTIDARKASTSVEGVSFYDVFMRALEKNGNPNKFFQALDINYTYMFELVSPETRVTIEYPEAAIYYLGARCICGTLQEEVYPVHTKDTLFFPFVKLPTIYHLSSLEDCIKVANTMSANEEGFVVRDGHFNRVKVKSPEYLIASRIRNNGAITTKRIIEAMRAGYLDDLYAYAPDYQAFIDSVLIAYKTLAAELASTYEEAQIKLRIFPDTPWHVIVNSSPASYRNYLFRRHAGSVANPYEYLDNLSVKSLTDWIKNFGQ